MTTHPGKLKRQPEQHDSVALGGISVWFAVGLFCFGLSQSGKSPSSIPGLGLQPQHIHSRGLGCSRGTAQSWSWCWWKHPCAQKTGPQAFCTHRTALIYHNTRRWSLESSVADPESHGFVFTSCTAALWDSCTIEQMHFGLHSLTLLRPKLMQEDCWLDSPRTLPPVQSSPCSCLLITPFSFSASSSLNPSVVAVELLHNFNGV